MPTPFPPEIIQIRSDIEKLLGQTLHTPADFQCFVQQIWETERRNHLRKSTTRATNTIDYQGVRAILYR